MSEFNSDDYLEQRQKQSKVTANFSQLKALLVLVVLAVFVYIAWYAYTSPGNVDDSSLPVIQASSEIIKSKPENPGGLVVANRDKAIFEGMSNVPAKKIKTEKTVTPPEANISKQVVAETIEKTLPVVKEPETVTASPNADFIVSKKAEESKTSSTQAVEQTSELDKELDDIQPNSVVEPVAPVESVTQPTIVVEPAPATGGLKLPKTYTVRIAALKTESAAIEAWKSLKATYRDVLGGLTSEIQVVEKDGKEVYYLHAGPITSQVQAEQICKSLQERGRRCRVY